MTATPDQVIEQIREALDYACNNEGTSSLISEFLLVRDQQTSQDERDEGERETSAFYIAQMVRRDAMKAIREKVRPILKEAEAERDALLKALEPFSKIAGEMFARNWNAKAIVVALDTPEDSHRLLAGDFFRARTLSGDKS
ncbi:hypothetical protein ABCW43_00345 [Neorhizobium sp. IRAMC:178]|uniref:hypothetical protein n=1 Tax=Neorhizobium tunisiense TaxID=3144793 RepID=UPI0031F61FB6